MERICRSWRFSTNRQRQLPLGIGPKPHETWHSGYYPVVWTNKCYRMVYFNLFFFLLFRTERALVIPSAVRREGSPSLRAPARARSG